MVEPKATFQARPATQHDIDAILAIETQCFAPGIREPRETFEDRILAFPQGFIILDQLDAHGGEPVGYISSELWDKIPAAIPEQWALGHRASQRHVPDGTVLYVSSFAVVPASRGGTGTAFFAEALSLITSRCRCVRQVAFIVSEEWTAARRIYEKAGFAYCGTIPDFFLAPSVAENDAAALIMAKDFQGGKECA